MSVLVVVESENRVIKDSSVEAIVYGTHLGEVTTLVIGNISLETLKDLGKYGTKHVLYTSDERLEKGVIKATATLISQVVEHVSANIVVMPCSSLTNSIAPILSVRLGAGIVTNAIDLPDLSEGFSVKKSIYTGKAFTDVQIMTSKKIITIKKNILAAQKFCNESVKVTVSAFTPDFQQSDFSIQRRETHKEAREISLPEADRVVSAGRGLKGPENWVMIEELARVLKAATACSKPVSDMGWRPHHEHVGQTGIKISPNLYIAVGISGAIQHLAGVSNSKVIVVINKDPDAPFFKTANYGIVGDAFEIVPRLTAVLGSSNL